MGLTKTSMTNYSDDSSLSSTNSSSVMMHFAQNKTLPGDISLSFPRVEQNILSASARISILPSMMNLFFLAMRSRRLCPLAFSQLPGHAFTDSRIPSHSRWPSTLYGL